MQIHLTLKSCLVALGLAVAAQTSVQAQNFLPIPLTPSSFTYQIVVPSNYLSKPNAQMITVTLDSGPSLETNASTYTVNYGQANPPTETNDYVTLSGNTQFEIGLDRSSAAAMGYGMPPSGSVLTNITMSDHIYQLGSWNNSSSNCLFIGNYPNAAAYTGGTNYTTGGFLYTGQNYTSGNLVVNDSKSYTAISILNSTGNGPGDETVTIYHLDGTSESYPVDFSDWFSLSTDTGTNASVSPNPTAAYNPSARLTVQPGSGFSNAGTVTGSRLWATDLSLADTTSPITNINFTYTGGGRTAIFAVSATSNPSDGGGGNAGPLAGPFAPLANMTGFNAGCVVPNFPGPLPYNATMDNGTNFTSGGAGGNTWGEKGWDLGSTNGFPFHGTSFTSFANPNRTYQMAPSYSVNMSVLVDTNHQSNNITPITPLAFTALSFLTAGANNGTHPMTNFCILQHSDGVNESNNFLGYDWFQSGVPFAWICNERPDLNNGGEIDNLNSGDPRLFESTFQTLDGTPVTNIIVGLSGTSNNADSSGSTTFILGISGTTNFILPVFGTNTAAQNVYAGQTAVYSVNLTLGAHPSPTFQWQVTDNATFTNNLNNGATGTGSTISGANTTTLTIADVSASDTGHNTYSYQCSASNPGGTVTSPSAPLTLLVSTGTNVVQPTDSISDFYGGPPSTPGEAFASPGGMTVNYAIDGTDQQYLNYGASGGNTSFQGPVGIIVQPSVGGTVLNAVRFIVPINAPTSDPADFSLDGSKDGVSWTPILADTALHLPNARNILETAAVDITNQVLEEVDFANSTAYDYYRVTVQNVKGGASAPSMQIGEIQFVGALGGVAPEIFVQPSPPNQLLQVGGSITWSIDVNGQGPITYQWYLITNGTTNAISGATSSSYSLPPVSLASGGSFFAVARNSFGASTSSIVTFTVSASTSTYENAILADHPIALFRLDEGPDNPPNDGVIAYDIAGGHNGYYSNVYLQQPGYSTNDSDNFSVQVGALIDPILNGVNGSTTVAQDNMVAGINGLNFGAPNGTSENFSVEAWVNSSQAQTAGAAIVAKGYAGGGDQFGLDTGGTASAFRFYFRNSLGLLAPVSPTGAPALNVWYHLVGVLNEASNAEYLYVNGVVVAQASLASEEGVLNSNLPITIGSRQSSATTNDNDQFVGFIANVAFYDTALDGGQVLGHYLASGQAPFFTESPSNTTVDIGQTAPAVFYSQAYGTGTISYQWLYNGSPLANGVSPSGTGARISGATSPTLTISNFTIGDNGEQYSVVVTNTYGSATAPLVGAATLTVASGPPVLTTDLAPLFQLGAIGTPFEYSVVVNGTAPFTYTWYEDGHVIAGATTSTYSNLYVLGTNTYYVAVSNAVGGGSGLVSSTATNIGLAGIPPITFPATGSNNWTINDTSSSPPPAGSNVLGNGRLTLTFNTGTESRTAWYDFQQSISTFTATYIYQNLTPGTGDADGVTFTVQNSPAGTAAIGAPGSTAGGDFAYAGGNVSPSACFAMNIYHGAGASANLDADTIMFGLDGVTPSTAPPMQAAAPVVPDGGDPIHVTVSYNGNTLTALLEDLVAGTSTSISTQVNLVEIVGTPAYIGFTGADGGAESTQQVYDFTFANGVLPPSLTVTESGGNITIGWPSSTSTLYILQTASQLTGPWSNITTGLSGAGAQITYTTPSTGQAAFYRLVLQ